jgi:hypothetical protein
MREKERRLKDNRTAEAQRKKYMGLEGKLGIICKSMGDEIIQEIDGGGWFESTEFDDPYALPDDEEEKIRTASESETNQIEGEEWADREEYDLYKRISLGWRFDGLRHGMHLEILYLRRGKRLTCTYKGYKVYEEKDGDLKCFNPFPEWEDMIDRLAPVAKEKTIETRKEIMQEAKVEDAKEKANWINEMRLKWGL